jgi:hypothetical protein
MTGGIEEHPPPLRARLELCHRRAQADRDLLGAVEVVGGEVEVQLLGPF